jgi:PAS domain S-box-containing protein
MIEKKPLKLLMIEDSEADALLLLNGLRRGGFEPEWQRVQTEPALRDALEKKGWDIVLCDYLMPQLDAPHALKTLRNADQEVPVIVVSGTVGEDIAVEVLKLGANDYLLKDNLTRLIPAVERELQDAELRRKRTAAELQRRRAEESLRLSEERYRVLFQGSPTPMWVCDRTTLRFLAVNSAAVNHYGFSEEEFLQMSLLDIRPPEDAEELRKRLGEADNAGPRTRSIQRHRKQDGSIIFVDVITEPIRFGRMMARIVVANDITERKQAEEELTRIKMAVEHATDAICISDPAGEAIFHNQAFATLLGYTAEQLNAEGGICALFSRRAQCEAAFRETARGGSWSGNALLRTAGDGAIELFLRANAVKDATGAVVASIFMGTDLRAQKQAQSKIEEQAALLDRATDAILVIDLHGAVQYWNRSAERVFGWMAEDALGRKVPDFLFKEPHRFDEALPVVLRKGEWTGDLAKLTSAGREVLVEARWTLLRDELGDPKSILLIDTDITEKKRLEAQYFRAQRMESIGTLAGGIAHDLNNVLGPIILAIDLLKMSNTNPRDRELLETMETSAARGAEMVKQVLSYARGIEGRRLLLRPETLIREMQKITSDTFPKSISVHTDLPDRLPHLAGDPTQLHQVLLNLCVNARDAMPEGGRLRLGAASTHIDEHFAVMQPGAEPGPYVVMEVGDSGVGMSQEVKEKIFEPFFTTKDVGKGTGLGLSTTQAIVKSHGGFVTVESEIGLGTTFRIYLPAEREEPDDEESDDEDELPHGRGETILLIDDEAAVLAITGRTLLAFGYKVRTARDGAEGIATYAQHPSEIAAVVTDMMMPVMDGVATIRALKRLDPEVRIIAASGISTKNSAAQVASEGVKCFLPKPYTAELLLKALDELLHGEK